MKRLVLELLGWGSIGTLAWLASGCGANDARGSNGPAATPEGGVDAGAEAGEAGITRDASGPDADGAVESGPPTDGGAGDAAALACPAGGFAGGLTVKPGQDLVLTTSCDVDGDLVIGATGAAPATLSVQGATLTVHGNVTLNGAGNFDVRGAGSALQLDNQSNFQRTIEAHDTSTVTLDGCALVTNLTGVDNFTSTYDAYDSTVFTANDVTIDTERSWLLGNLYGSATLHSTNSAVPVEIYTNDQTTLTSSGPSDQHTIWMVFASGSSGSLTLPNPSPPVTWAAGRASGQSVGWQVNVDGAMPLLAFESHAGSSWQLHGSGSTQKEATIGVYVDPPTTPSQAMTFDSLPLETVGTSSAPYSLTPPWAASPQLSLYGVDLGPVGWQIYVGGGGAPSVSATISNSPVNEVGAFPGGQVEISQSVTQLAVLAAEGQSALLHVTGTDVWSQAILAGQGGTIQIDTSNVYGALLEADPGGTLEITDALTTFYADGESSTCDPSANLTYMATSGGVPMCNPFTTPGQLSKRLDAGGTLSVSGDHPACFAQNGSYEPGFLFDPGSNTMNPAGGTVQCSGGVSLSATFTAYPVSLPGVPAGDMETCVVATSGGTNSYTVTAPTCQ